MFEWLPIPLRRSAIANSYRKRLKSEFLQNDMFERLPFPLGVAAFVNSTESA
jgi:hypothetical protein